MKTFLIYIIIVIFLYSCKCGQTELSDTEKQWVATYNSGQVIIFKSDLNNYDTLKVTEKRDFYTNCNQVEVGSTKFHVISVDLKPSICRDPNYCEVSIEMEKDEQRVLALPFIRVFGLEYSPAIQSQKLQTTSITLTTTNKRYNPCYVFESGVLARSYGNNYLKSFYWDKRDGLIRYTNRKNETFELYKK